MGNESAIHDKLLPIINNLCIICTNMHNFLSIYGPSYFRRSKEPIWFFRPIGPNRSNWTLLDLIVLLCAQFTVVVFPDAVVQLACVELACQVVYVGGQE
jgi:hypothetical protein